MDSSIIFKLFIVPIIFLTIALGIGGMGDLKKVRRIGVTGSGFIVLASTLTVIHKIPLEGLAFLLGVDKFMSEAKAITNFIGNGVASIVISKSEGEFITVENPMDIERE